MRMVWRRKVLLCNALWLLLLLLFLAVKKDDSLASASESAAAAASETELSTLIRAQEWSLALQHLEGHPEQAKVWMERRGAHHGKLVFRQLPLHLVFENSQEEEEDDFQDSHTPREQFSLPHVDLILKLIDSYPDACGLVDLQQRTPLHKAVYSAIIPPVDIVQTLMECFPTASRMRDDQDKLPMHAAVSFPLTSVENVQLLYQFYPPALSVRDEDDAYPIHLLAWGGTSKDALPILLLLLQHEPQSLLTKDGDEDTPLTIMAKYGKTSPDVVRYVLSRHPEQAATYRDEEGNTLLHHAVRTSNNANILEAFLLANPMAAQVPNQLGLLPLHVALWKCCVEKSIVQRLLQVYPAAASIKDRSGHLPLHYACQEGVSDASILGMLLEHGPRAVQEPVWDGSLPLHLALRRAAQDNNNNNNNNSNMNLETPNNAVIAQLIPAFPAAAAIPDPQSKLYPLHVALLSGRPVVVLTAIVQAYPNALTVWIQPPDHTGIDASSLSSWHLLTILGSRLYSPNDLAHVWNVYLNYPDGISQVDSAGRLPFHYAFDGGSMATATLLLEAHPEGAKVQDNHHRLPLLNACHFKDTQTALRLLDLYPQGAQMPDSSDRYALHEACARTPRSPTASSTPTTKDDDDDLNPIIDRLLEVYPDAVSKVDSKGNSPLHLLSESSGQHRIKRDTMENLIRVFPNATRMVNNAGFLPLHKVILAAIGSSDDAEEVENSAEAIALLLREYPAGALVPDRLGRTPLLRLFQSTENMSSLRLQEIDPVLRIARSLYELSPESVVETDTRGRNVLHYCSILVGMLGGDLTEAWAAFVEEIIQDYPASVKVLDKEKRTPLHLAMLYLGDTAIGERGDDQGRASRQFTNALKRIVEMLIVGHPEALGLQEYFGLKPYEMITHRRLKEAKPKAYKQSPIINNVAKLLLRGNRFWELVHSFRKMEGNFDPERGSCDELNVSLLKMEEQLGLATKADGAELNVDSSEKTCSQRQQSICQACPSVAEPLARVSLHLIQYAAALDDKQSESGSDEEKT